jgi:uracil-DNA glycosylase family 4
MQPLLFQNPNKNIRFDDLIQSVQHCDLCRLLCCRKKILSKANGNIESKVLFIAEAPGRLGADRTGIPMCGDRTGNNFEMFLSNIGWKRQDIFISNAILCNPKQENGNNATPTLEEIENCSAYLRMTINLVNPEVIVPLGRTALIALNLIHQHNFQLADNVAISSLWGDKIVFPLYHPGPRSLVHRSITKQRADYITLQKLVDPIQGLKKKSIKKPLQKIDKENSKFESIYHVILAFFSHFQPGTKVTLFKLTKLLYLFDLEAKRQLGHTYASKIYIRQQDGPWAPDLHKVLKSMEGNEVIKYYNKNNQLYYQINLTQQWESLLGGNITSIISKIFEKYGNMSNKSLKSIVYLTDPMRFILKQESKGMNFIGKPVLYNDKEAQEMV